MKDTVRLDSEEKARFIADKVAQSSASHGTGRHDTVPDGVTQDSAKHDTAQQDRVADDSAPGSSTPAAAPMQPGNTALPGQRGSAHAARQHAPASLKAAAVRLWSMMPFRSSRRADSCCSAPERYGNFCASVLLLCAAD